MAPAVRPRNANATLERRGFATGVFRTMLESLEIASVTSGDESSTGEGAIGLFMPGALACDTPPCAALALEAAVAVGELCLEALSLPR
jgi:hypothetical protein